MEESVFNISVFLAATFAAALVTGLAGFAFGLVAAAAWLHILSPLQTATLIIAFGLVVQGISVWKLREALRWNRLWPFLVGAAVGCGYSRLGSSRPCPHWGGCRADPLQHLQPRSAGAEAF